MFDCDGVVEFLNTSKWRNGTRNIVAQAYRDFQEVYDLKPMEMKKRHVVQQLPFVPLESEIDALIWMRPEAAHMLTIKR